MKETSSRKILIRSSTVTTCLCNKICILIQVVVEILRWCQVYAILSANIYLTTFREEDEVQHFCLKIPFEDIKSAESQIFAEVFGLGHFIDSDWTRRDFTALCHCYLWCFRWIRIWNFLFSPVDHLVKPVSDKSLWHLIWIFWGKNLSWGLFALKVAKISLYLSFFVVFVKFIWWLKNLKSHQDKTFEPTPKIQKKYFSDRQKD